MSDPELDFETRKELQRKLMRARSALGRARRAKDDAGREMARQQIQEAKVALGERGPVWWRDGAADENRRMAVNTPYREWFESLPAADEPSKP